MRQPFGTVTMPHVRRMAELHDAGLSYAAIAVVMKVDEALDLSVESVRHHVRVVAGRPGRLRGRGSAGLAGGGDASFGRKPTAGERARCERHRRKPS